MTYKNKILSIIFMGFISISMTHAANVILKDGSSYQGEIKSQNSETLIMDVNGIEMRIPTSNVSAIDLQGTTAQAPTAASPSSAATKPNATGPVTVSAGTTLTVRMMESVNTRHNKTGQRFTAQLEANLMSGDTVVAPKGAQVYGVLTNVKKAGRIAGSAAMTFELRDISIDNVMVAIRTQPVSGEGQNTARSSVGKTARGAAIGGLIDGSDGAKTGAKVGVGAAILTKGDDIELPQGTLVDFILAAPLER
ncbi:MAG: hypothetical protein V7782_06675 [Psychromonas sp.]